MVDIEPLSAELQKVAIEELNEVPSRIPQDLECLKLWISQQPHLNARNDDQLLVQFLRGSKYSLEKAKERIDLYYTLKTKFPQLFALNSENIKELQEILRLGCTIYLPKPLHGCGPRLIIFRYNFKQPEQSLNHVVNSLSALYDLILINDPYACIYGVTYIIDMSLFSVNHMMSITPALMKKTFAYFTKTMPLRIKGIYYINTSPLALQFYKIMLPFMPEKLKQRIHMCGSDMNELQNHIPLEYLPQDYGGDNGCIADLAEDTLKMFNENLNYLQENLEFGVEETLRPGKPMDFDSIYGMEGSFRKLEVD